MRKSEYNIEEMIASITDENRHPEVNWGPAVGREVLPPELFYGTGDATLPTGEGRYVIAHLCNDIGVWGRGFVVALARRYPNAEAEYRAWSRRKADPPFVLGQVQFVEVAAQTWVANMIGQHGIGRRGPTTPIRYDAVRECLGRVRAFAQERKATIQMPRIGCGLAGGDWEVVSKIVEEELVLPGLAVMVLDPPTKDVTGV